jgi:hypothetical protein
MLIVRDVRDVGELGELKGYKIPWGSPDKRYLNLELSSTFGFHQMADATHPWIAPQPGASRSPCPALNSLANHGYL